jgi:hypothetical protein
MQAEHECLPVFIPLPIQNKVSYRDGGGNCWVGALAAATVAEIWHELVSG